MEWEESKVQEPRVIPKHVAPFFVAGISCSGGSIDVIMWSGSFYLNPNCIFPTFALPTHAEHTSEMGGFCSHSGGHYLAIPQPPADMTMER